MNRKLLTPRETDALLRYPHGRSIRLARAGKLPFVTLPDGSVRFPTDLLERIAPGLWRSTDEEPTPPADAAEKGGES